VKYLVAMSATCAIAAVTTLSLKSVAESAPLSTTRLAARFEDIAPVLQSPRCMNCHTVTSFPRQGDDRHRHSQNVSRGADNHGAAGLKCSTCHVDHNQASSGVPGAPKWGLAPLSMAWEGLSVANLCKVLKDPTKNGGRSIDDLVSHMTEDPLVQWAWNPGGGRMPPPVAQSAFHDLVRQWAAAGAECPAT
jgi:hypothetical protein